MARDVTTQVETLLELERAPTFQSALLASSPDLVSVGDLRTGATVWASRSLGEMLGHDLGEVNQPNASRRLGHPDDAHIITAALTELAVCADGEVVTSLSRVLHADGSWHWLSRRSTPFRRDEAGAVIEFMTIARDVTEQQRLQADLEEVRAFQQAVLASSPDIVSVYDLDAAQTTWASRSLAEVLGRNLAEIRADQKDGWGALIHPDDIPLLQTAFAEVAALSDGEVHDCVVRTRHGDGTWHHLSRRSTPFHRDARGRVTQVLTVAHDVTREREAALELERVRSFQDAVIATTPDLIAIMTTAGSPVWMSRDPRELVGYSRDELMALGPVPIRSLVHPEDLPAYDRAEADVGAAADGQVVQVRFRARHQNGGWRWLARRMIPFSRTAHGELAEFLVIVRDVTDTVTFEQQLTDAALHDPLTDLPNRELVNDRLEQGLASLTNGGSLAVLFLDLDGFKQINDTQGHAAGDAVLREIARRLEHTVRPQDTVGRMGGDEFVIVISDDTQAFDRDVTALADRVRFQVAEPIAHEGNAFRVTASIGIAHARAHDHPDTVLRAADRAMYQAKTAGKDRAVTSDADDAAHILPT